MLTTLCHIFWTTFRDLEVNELLRRGQPMTVEGTRKTIDDHRRILAAVRSHDGALASRLMYDHFAKIERLSMEKKQ